MRVALVQPKFKRFGDPVCPPLGLMSVAAVARNLGHDVEIIDRNLTPFTIRNLVDFAPDVVGVSSLTGPMLKDAIWVSKAVKRILGEHVPIVWGGMHATTLPTQVLNDDFVDFVVVGEGEYTFVELLDVLVKGGSISGVRGLAHKEGGTPAVNGGRPLIRNLDTLPALPWDMVNSSFYFRRDIALITSRGCPFTCAYCYNSEYEGRGWRPQSPDRVLRDIELAASHTRTRSLKLYDDNFPTNRRRCLAILRRVPAEYSLFVEVSPNFVDDEFLRVVSKLRKVWLFMGIESGSDRMLKKMHRRVSVDQIRRAFGLIRNYDNVRTIGNVVIGCPTETEEELRMSMELLREVNPTRYNVSIYTPYPGNTFFNELVAGGFEAPKDTAGWARLVQDFGDYRMVISGSASFERTLKRCFLRGQWRTAVNALSAREYRFLLGRLGDFRYFVHSISACTDRLRNAFAGEMQTSAMLRRPKSHEP